MNPETMNPGVLLILSATTFYMLIVFFWMLSLGAAFYFTFEENAEKFYRRMRDARVAQNPESPYLCDIKKIKFLFRGWVAWWSIMLIPPSTFLFWMGWRLVRKRYKEEWRQANAAEGSFCFFP